MEEDPRILATHYMSYKIGIVSVSILHYVFRFLVRTMKGSYLSSGYDGHLNARDQGLIPH